jgi:hypothetical protein
MFWSIMALSFPTFFEFGLEAFSSFGVSNQRIKFFPTTPDRDPTGVAVGFATQEAFPLGKLAVERKFSLTRADRNL